MNNRTKLIITTVAASTMLVVSSTPALAAADNQTKPSFWDKIMLGIGFKKQQTPEKRAERIEAMKAKHQQKLDSKLNAAVASGAITTEQKDVLANKISAIEEIKRQSAGQTRDQKKEALKSARADLKQWASDNNVKLADIMPAKPKKTN